MSNEYKYYLLVTRDPRTGKYASSRMFKSKKTMNEIMKYVNESETINEIPKKDYDESSLVWKHEV